MILDFLSTSVSFQRQNFLQLKLSFVLFEALLTQFPNTLLGRMFGSGIQWQVPNERGEYSGILNLILPYSFDSKSFLRFPQLLMEFQVVYFDQFSNTTSLVSLNVRVECRCKSCERLVIIF